MSSSHSNFMGGECYELFNPIQALRLPLCSQFLGEPSYYMPTRDKVPAEKAWGSGRLKESETKQILEKLGKHIFDPKLECFGPLNMSSSCFSQKLGLPSFFLNF